MKRQHGRHDEKELDLERYYQILWAGIGTSAVVVVAAAVLIGAVAALYSMFKSSAGVPVAVGMMAVGAIIFFVDIRTPLLIRGIGAFMALVGFAVAAARLSGLYRRHYLRFEPHGIVFGQPTYRFCVPWDSIGDIAAGDYIDNPIVLIRLNSLEAIEVDPSTARSKFGKYVLTNRKLLDADVAVMPQLHGFDSPPLVAALIRYVREPDARRELDASTPRLASAPPGLSRDR